MNWGWAAVDIELDEPEESDKKKDDDKISNKLGYSRFMIEDVWAIGTKRLLKANLKETRRGAKVRSDRKARINAAIADVVKQRKIEKISVEVDLPWWKKRIQSMYPKYYK